ncbi:hypothetical protein L596_012560 [Steinernema carpocapsae]|uniref:7TM GPCR serpentine receptor class x (Srx) domain-containing protein n=1 Tax=Steinernema carpocapsae TaxID=34508 RepID=A0A4U5NXK3_STECR|nr:hypothetical protein L596_012560 [Steinernema carpocapsae]
MENSTIEELEDFVLQETSITATITGINGLISIIINGFLLFKVSCHHSFGHNFGWIWISRLVALLVPSIFQIGVYVPEIATYGTITFSTGFYFCIKQIDLICSIHAVLCNLLIIINRFVLVSRIQKYKEVYSNWRTICMVGLAWIIAIVSIAPFSVLPICKSIRKTDNFSESGFNCVFALTVTMFVVIWGTILITLLVTKLTIQVLRKIQKAMMMSIQTDFSVVLRIEPEELKMMLSPDSHRKQFDLCYMIVLQCILTPAVMIANILSGYIEDPFVQFLSGGFLWTLHNTLNGLTVIAFNRDIRFFKRAVKPRKMTTRGASVKYLKTSSEISFAEILRR